MSKRMSMSRRAEWLARVLVRAEKLLLTTWDSTVPPLFSMSDIAHFSGLSNSTHLRNIVGVLVNAGVVTEHPFRSVGGKTTARYRLTSKGRHLCEQLEDMLARTRSD